MPERIHFEDLLGSLVYDAITRGLREEEFQESIALPEGVCWKSFAKEFKRLQQKYEDYSDLRAAGAITQDLLNAYWNEQPTREELAYGDVVLHHAMLV